MATLERTYRKAWTKRERKTVSQWADQHRYLDPMFSAEPGLWSTARVPYMREWMDSANLPWVRRISICASTQVGKTEFQNNLLGFHIQHDPCPMMMVMPRRDDARLVGDRRIMPMVRESPKLRRELTDARNDVTKREISFRKCVLYLRAAQSPADLAGVPIRLVCGDEVDKWPKWTGKEASPLDLVSQRTSTFPDHLIVVCSTPTTRAGLIQHELEAGDQRRYHVPCPHCGHLQAFVWRLVKWPDDIRSPQEMRKRKQAWYECEHCQERIDDQQKLQVLARGVWVPKGKTAAEWAAESAEDRADHRSFHIWAAYSPWLTWWKIAAQWLESKDEPGKLMNFVNSVLGEIWEDRVLDTSDAAIAACIEPRLMDQGEQLPDVVRVFTAAVDVQGDYMAWGVWGWGLDEESWVVAAGISKTWSELEDVLFRNAWGKQQIPLRCCLIDSRHRRDEVMGFARRWQPVAHMIAGVEREAPVPFSTVRIDKHPRTGAVLEEAMVVWTINVGLFKDMVAARFAKATREGELSMAGRIHLPSDLPANFATHLSSEHKVRERSGSKERMRWVLKPGHQRNEFWDIAVYNAAAARMVRVDRLRSPENGPGFQRPPAPTAQPWKKRGPRVHFPKLGGQ